MNARSSFELRATLVAGVLQNVEPAGNREPEKGTRQDPEVLQLGLTQSEIEAIEKRLAKLLERVDKGEVPLLEGHGTPGPHRRQPPQPPEIDAPKLLHRFPNPL